MKLLMVTEERLMLRKIFVVGLLSSSLSAMAQRSSGPVQMETLTQTTSSWDGTPYKAYPTGQPQLSVLKVTLAPHTTMRWHTHPVPNAAYVLSGEVTVESKDGAKKHFVAGQAVPETVDIVHRGVSGDDPAVLIVFYAGTPGVPLSQPAGDGK
jgi:quercetin dioxygenase-like cupin family protein